MAAKKDRHRFQPLQLRMHPIYLDRLRKLAAREKSTVTAVAIAAIEAYLAARGLWKAADAAKK